MFKLFLFKPRIRYDILIFNQKEDIVKLIGNIIRIQMRTQKGFQHMYYGFEP